MVSINLVRASNAALKSQPSRITALFVGGTSGIGLSTLRALARHTDGRALTAYIVGRSETRAKSVLADLQTLNPSARFNFIEADVSLIKNVDRACKTVLGKEKGGKLDLLFMTPGGISVPFKGRDETPEGLDRLFSLRYYARMRLITNLLPLLTNTSNTNGTLGHGGRVISIYGGGFEYPIDTSDLALKKNFSLLNAYKHSITMTSLSMSYLSKTNPRVSFIHGFPGLVGTNIYSNSFPGPVAAVYNYGVWPLMWPFSVNVQESGERHLFHATSERYPARDGGNGSGEVAVGVDGVKGSGVYLLNWKGDVRETTNALKRYLADGTDERVWRHTEELLKEAAEK
ncbi:hypothetical protein BDW74DRAFT_189752 [Aspergillus multicolor]|uniref:uncharacterized protein n=1 Tax=Aspergillus multicolor TaxID=41759 RepID=UPI003CCE2F79